MSKNVGVRHSPVASSFCIAESTFFSRRCCLLLLLFLLLLLLLLLIPVSDHCQKVDRSVTVWRVSLTTETK